MCILGIELKSACCTARTLLTEASCLLTFSFCLNQKPWEHENLVVDRDDRGVIFVLSRKSLGTYLAACKKWDNSSLLSVRSGEDVCRLQANVLRSYTFAFFHSLIQSQNDILGPCV